MTICVALTLVMAAVLAARWILVINRYAKVCSKRDVRQRVAVYAMEAKLANETTMEDTVRATRETRRVIATANKMMEASLDRD